jgi:ankyrin repeat protein
MWSNIQQIIIHTTTTVYVDSVDCINCLLDHNADADRVDDLGWSALHVAVHELSLESMKVEVRLHCVPLS